MASVQTQLGRNAAARTRLAYSSIIRSAQGMAMDVIVLGGGLMGAASAYFLARRGARATLLERHRIGSGATVASFGNIRRTGRHLSQLALAHRSLGLWGEADKVLG